MTAELHTEAGQRKLRSVARTLIPAAKATHIAEAVASGWGFRSSRALTQAVDDGLLASRTFDPSLFLNRLRELGAPLPTPDTHLEPMLWAATQPRKSAARMEAARERLFSTREVPIALTMAEENVAQGNWRKACDFASIVLRDGSPTEKALAFALIDRLQDQSPYARLAKGVALGGGDGTSKNNPAARELLAPLCHPGIGDQAIELAANATMGFLWFEHGGRAAMPLALRHWERAAELGNPQCAFNAAMMYDSDEHGILRNRARAKALYRIAVAQGHVASMTNLGLLVQAEDPEESITLLERAAGLGDDQARVALSMMDRIIDNAPREDQIPDFLKGPEESHFGRIIQPRVWIRILQTSCRWSIADTVMDATENGRRVGAVVISGNRSIPLYMSAITHVPDDTADLREQSVKAQIARRSATAVLLFNQPLVRYGDGSGTYGGVYGGQMLMNGVWRMFVLRPGQLFNEVIEQHAHAAMGTSDAFFERFGCSASEAMRFASEIFRALQDDLKD